MRTVRAVAPAERRVRLVLYLDAGVVFRRYTLI